jgi:hypothetical protein
MKYLPVCNFPVTSSLFGPKYLPQHPTLQHLYSKRFWRSIFLP